MRNPPALPRIKPIVLDGYSLDVDHFIRQEYLDISKAAIELPVIAEWLNQQAQVYIESKLATKAAIGRAEAEAFFALKNGEFQRKGYGDKSTDKSLAMAVCLDETVIKLNEEYAIYAALVERLTNVQRSIQFKLELVRSSEATRRNLED